MSEMRRFILTGIILAGGHLLSAGQGTAAEPERTPEFSSESLEFFESRIRPLLANHCFECHSHKSDSVKGKLLLDRRSGFLTGGDSGPAIVPGEPGNSLLIEAVNYAGYEMPPSGKLPDEAIADFEQWVKMGAPWPAEAETPETPDLAERVVDEAMIDNARGQYWAFQDVEKQPLPQVSNPSWPRTRIDQFILQQLDERGMKPAPEADRRALIHRLYFDVIGLPPSDSEVQAFLADDDEQAYEHLVDHLLASPHYGERWGRYWLDVARYGEDHPNGALPPRYAHLYREWVINALNEDLPYDEFLRRQLAAETIEGLPRSELAALGFLGLSPTYVIDEKFAKEVVQTIVADEWDERVDVITRGLLGLTVACARCHDHKYDPITTRDYYALAGVMANTQLVETPVPEIFEEDAEYIAALTEDLRFHEKRYESRYKQRQGLIKDKEPDIYRYDKEILESASEIQRIKSLLPENYRSIPRVNAVRDAAVHVNPEFYVIRELISPEAKFWRHLEYNADRMRDLPVHVRGSVTQLGEIVPRRFLEVLSSRSQEPFRQGSGRRELAEAIVNDAASLTGRVIVNRVWGWHFGKALVRTTSNFGELGERPTHPQLLDDLTAWFLENGWSLKKLHREILLSSTYRQSSLGYESYEDIDPDNLCLSRMNRRRLDVESWRDAMLKVSENLNMKIGGKSFDLADAEASRRTVYGKVSREKLPDVLQIFDFPEATRHSDGRTLTTTPLQQLYYMNSEFVDRCAAAIVKMSDGEDSPDDWAHAVYHQVLARNPTEQELLAMKQLIWNDNTLDETSRRVLVAQALLTSNEFLFVD